MTLLWILIPYAALGAVLTLCVRRDWQPVEYAAACFDRRGSNQTGSAMVPTAACTLGATLKKQTESTGIPRARAASAGTFRREGHREWQRRQRDQRLGRNPRQRALKTEDNREVRLLPAALPHSYPSPT